MQVSTLRPGFLVSLKTSLKGNVQYFKQMLEEPHLVATGEEKARWQTERTVRDRAEHDAASQARTAARGAVTKVCVNSNAFGLLCPEDRATDLDAAIKEARRIADDFNRTAVHTRLKVYIIPGRIAPEDKEAIAAINSEITDLIEQMLDGVSKADVAMVRDAANKARGLGIMLSPDIAEKVQDAVDAARSVARKIVADKGLSEIENAKRELDRLAKAVFIKVETKEAAPTLNLDAIEAALKARV